MKIQITRAMSKDLESVKTKNSRELRSYNSFGPLEDFVVEKIKNRSNMRRKWTDPDTGHSLSAGGILFYDEVGIWVVGEKEHGELKYSDIGGKYEYEDGNIWTTIRRELYEETYGCCDVLSGDIVDLSKKYPPVYVNGHKRTPVYACLVVPITETLLFTNFLLDSDAFAIRRKQTLKENSEVPTDYYPFVLKKILYRDLKNQRLSYRLQRILRFSNVLNNKTQLTKKM